MRRRVSILAIGDVMVINVSYVFEERLLADFVQTRQSVLTARDLNGKKIIAAAICPAEERNVWIERVGNETPIETVADLNGVSLYEAEELSRPPIIAGCVKKKRQFF